MAKKVPLPLKEIPDPESVLRSCRKVFVDVLGNKTLTFRSEPIARNKSLYVLTGNNGSSASITGRNYPVFSLAEANNELFWLGGIFLFGFDRGVYSLDSISLVVVKGLWQDDKLPVMRAEWDCADVFLDSSHAQPHWHIYSSSILNMRLDFDEVLDAITDPIYDVLFSYSKNIKISFALFRSYIVVMFSLFHRSS